MQIPLQITFRGLSPIASVRTLNNERWGRLERFCERMLRGHVIIGLPHRHHRNGRRYSVHLDIGTPFGSVIVTREPTGDGSAEELDIAIREAFEAILSV